MAEQKPFGVGLEPFSDVALAANPEPRCPCVLLLDVSGSMCEVVANVGRDTGQTLEQDGKTYRVVSGGTTKIDLLNEGLKAYHDDLMADSLAPQRVEVCRHLVKDRMERAGMHWTLEGAQAMLDLRSVWIAGQWEPFQKHRIERDRERLHPHRDLVAGEAFFALAP